MSNADDIITKLDDILRQLSLFSDRLNNVESRTKELIRANNCNDDATKITEEVIFCRIGLIEQRGNLAEQQRIRARLFELAERQRAFRLRYELRDHPVSPPPPDANEASGPSTPSKG